MTGSIRFAILVLGIFCGIVSFVLYVSLQLMKKLAKRMERVNTLVQVQACSLALMALLLYSSMNLMINFDNVNASDALNLQVPYKLHHRYYGICWVLFVISIVSFCASYFESKILF